MIIFSRFLLGPTEAYWNNIKSLPYILLVGVFILCGCAPRAVLEKYPVRKIDRPLSYPKGMHSWNINHTYTDIQIEDGEGLSDRSTSYLSWKISLTNSIDMGLLGPVPWSVYYELVRNERLSFCLGLSAGGLSFHDDGNTWAPEAVFFLRYRILRYLALETYLRSETTVISRYDLQSSSAGMNVSCLFQIRNDIALRLGTAIVGTRGPLFNTPFVPNVWFDDYIESISTFIPVHSEVSIALSQWDISAGYTYCGTGYPNGYSSRETWVALTRYW